MKRIFIAIFTLALVGITACGKTTNRKVTNEWKVTSMESIENNINSSGDKHISTFSVNGNTVTDKNDDYPSNGVSSSTVRTGTMNTNELTIKKDGTWTWTMSATYPGDNGNSSYTEMVDQSGTWSFLTKSKGDDFKKNERLVFNILAAKIRDIEVENGVTVQDDKEELVYSTGKYTTIYTVKESKNNRLELELETQNVATQNSFESSSSTSRTMTLESK